MTKHRRLRGAVLVLVLALGLYQVLRGPPIWQAGSLLPGGESDNYYTVWQLWASAQAKSGSTPLVNFPFGATVEADSTGFLPTSPAFWRAFGVDEVWAFNVSLLTAFLLSAVCTYWLIVQLTGLPAAGIICGLAFALLPYATAMSEYHAALAHIELFPLFFVMLLAFLRRPKWYTGGGCLLVQCLGFWTNAHYGLFTYIILLVFLCVRVFYRGVRGWGPPTLRKTGGALALAALAALTGVPQFLNAGPGPGELVLGKPFEQLYAYSARVWSYVVPPAGHPLLGKYTRAFVESGVGGGYVHEQALYLGLTLLVLGILGTWYLWRSRKPEHRFFGVFLPAVVLVAFLCSMPPTVGALGVTLPMPGLLLHRIFPMLRVYARFGIVVATATVVLAGFGVAWVLSHKRATKTVGVVLGGMMLFEFLAIPQYVQLSEPPAVYTWLAKQEEVRAIAEYPLDWPAKKEGEHLNLWDLYEYMLWQRVHRKPLFNGEPRLGLDLALKLQLVDPAAQNTPEELQWLGVTHMVIHTKHLAAETVEKLLNRPDLRLVYQDDEAAVLRIVGSPVRLGTEVFGIPSEIAVDWGNGTARAALTVQGGNMQLLTYGPYMALYEGEYRASYDVELLGQGEQTILFSVTADGGRTTLAEKRVTLPDAGLHEVEFRTSGATLVEFRVLAPAGRYEFGGVTLERLSDCKVLSDAPICVVGT